MNTRVAAAAPESGFVLLDGALPAYRIVDHDRLQPFLMTVVSAWDHWLFVSSTGGLTAGRGGPDAALFPYETDDRLHHAAGISGPLTLLRVLDSDGVEHLWEPFASRPARGTRRHLSRSLAGDAVEFEEAHEALGLTFRYRWTTSAAFGFVRRCTLERHAGRGRVQVHVLDGLLNLMPPLVELGAQQGASCLVDAYKLAERGAGTAAIYSLTSRIVDRPEPAEALRGSVAWCHGLVPEAVLLSDESVAAFREGAAPRSDERVLGRRFAYLVTSRIALDPGTSRTWHIVSDVQRSPAEIVALMQRLTTSTDAELEAALRQSIADGHERLHALVASADGLQCTGARMDDAHHFANVLFNIMRGGVFVDGHRVRTADVSRFLAVRNGPAHRRHADRLEALPESLPYDELLAVARGTGDADFIRLCHEYLPLTFSRRHGDPSRPWNRFTIRVSDETGLPSLGYEGNWRDIFQNWEALVWSFPGFIESVVAKFVNASTLDGFNPYRMTREGVDWEVPDEGNPWSNIGYWGDHQTIYLLKLLEASRRFRPNALEAMLDAPIFSYANVPYRIAPYSDLLADPHHTIAFDRSLHRAIEERVRAVGTDARLVTNANGDVVHVNLIEKLLVTALARLSNLVPDGGIWMNTQRPEWNDANNALVGYGVSVVTLGYLRRFLSFAIDLLAPRRDGRVPLSGAVAAWFDGIAAALDDERRLLDAPSIADADRKRVLDRLGHAYAAYREAAYAGGPGAPVDRPVASLLELLETGRAWVDHALVANRRPDGLYHAYNLLVWTHDGHAAALDRLPEMLEGQVAVLSSGLLSGSQSLDVLDALFASALYRDDQRSFILYPTRRLPGLLERGRLPEDAVARNPLLVAQLARHPRPLVQRDVEGTLRFAPDFRNAAELEVALDALASTPAWAGLVAEHRRATLELYEQVFHHKAHTGRSGTMVAYEGIGSIYWHMVSKLLLAVQETLERTTDEAERVRLADAYRRIRSGLSASKSPEEYGAFPFDPYSHTPAHRGAQQPGMTGQVKEEILCRWGELGVSVRDGRIAFSPNALTPAIPPEGLAFTFCGTPVCVAEGPENSIAIHRTDGAVATLQGASLDASTSAELFARSGGIARIDVTVRPAE